MEKRTYITIMLAVLTIAAIFLNTAVFDDSDNPDLDPKQFYNIAHRGASGDTPELTMAAFDRAVEKGADYIEVDLQMTKDGVIVLMHDETVNRTTDGTGLVSELTLAEIKQLDAGSWFNEAFPEKAQPEYIGLEVPTLREVIEEYSDELRLYIEIKEPNAFPDLEEKLVFLLNDTGLIGEDVPPGNVLIQSFGAQSLYNIYLLQPDIPLIQLISYSDIPSITGDAMDSINEYAVGIGLSYTQITRSFMKEALSRDLLVHPYTVNKPEHMETLIEWGATGIITNYPGVLQEVIERNKEELIGYN
ncbi:glycerophosphodiester phosphodiesterase [Planococcus lenghuensis]|uniref:GP-PDE domain-containing protein n=1 Tax=Planococcus lenghuensis TaxID=2213202 RepID=A0A1Q2KW38_9BACL|nr:glycerophosphodiester phosphodiesterase [Planococcus lenghuensis]AQQ52336.1 hypothetical protein B0X71_03900 [Planococcus lenghuensis]